MEPTLSVKALRGPLFAAAVRVGSSPSELAAGLKLPPEWLSDIDARLPHTEALRVWDAMVEKTGDPHLGLLAAELQDGAPMLLVDLALSVAPNVRALFASFARFQKLFHEANECVLRSEPEVVVLVHRLTPGVLRCRPLTEFILASWARKCRRMVGPDLVIEARLRDPASPFEARFRESFGAPVRFDAGEDALVFPASILDRPLAGGTAAAQATIEKMLEEMLEAQADFVSKARTRLATLIAGGSADADVLARELAVSTRSLQRRLAERGTSFQQLLDGVRHRLSLSHLARPEVSLTEIAFLLGFSELSAFSRAFRRWTGKSPAEFRRA